MLINLGRPWLHCHRLTAALGSSFRYIWRTILLSTKKKIQKKHSDPVWSVQLVYFRQSTEPAAMQTVLTRGRTEVLLRQHTAPGSVQQAAPSASACSACAKLFFITLTNWFCRILQLEQHHVYKCHRLRIKSSSAHKGSFWIFQIQIHLHVVRFEAMNLNEGTEEFLTKTVSPLYVQAL